MGVHTGVHADVVSNLVDQGLNKILKSKMSRMTRHDEKLARAAFSLHDQNGDGARVPSRQCLSLWKNNRKNLCDGLASERFII